MAHEVTLNLNSKFVFNKDIEIEIKTDDGKLGTLLISKGNVEWMRVGNSINKKRLKWKDFAALLELLGKTVKVAKSVTRSVKKKAESEFGDFTDSAQPKIAKKASRKSAKKLLSKTLKT